jgi:hypothetical protein
MAEIFGVLIYAGICFLCDKAKIQNNIGPVSANLLTIPLNSNELPSGVIGDACNYERKTHNEAKAQKEMRENDARQRREDEKIEQHMKKYAYTAERKLAEEKDCYLRCTKNIKDGKGLGNEKRYVERYELDILYDSGKITCSEYNKQREIIEDKYRNEIAEDEVRQRMILKLHESDRKIKIEDVNRYTRLINSGNLLQFKKNIKDGKGREYEKQFVELYELEILRATDKIGFEYVTKKDNIYDKYYGNLNKTFGENIKIEAPHTPPASLKITTTPSLPKTTQCINTYMKTSTEAYSLYNAGKITASEYLKLQNNVSEVYDKCGHLTLTSTQFSNQVYIKIAEDAGNQYKAGKLKPAEFVKICNDAKTKYYTEPVKQSTPVPTQPNSTLNNIGNGYVASAQARVNAVNLATTAVSTTARAVANVASAVGHAYIQGSNDMANTRRMEAQATQQLVSNVASAVVNNAPQVIRETAQGVSSFGFEVATQVASGLHTTNLMISGANEALSSINDREKGVVETTGEAVATGVATYVGGQVGSVIATGLLVKTAIETNMNVVGNIIQEEINRHQQGGV